MYNPNAFLEPTQEDPEDGIKICENTGNSLLSWCIFTKNWNNPFMIFNIK